MAETQITQLNIALVKMIATSASSWPRTGMPPPEAATYPVHVSAAFLSARRCAKNTNDWLKWAAAHVAQPSSAHPAVALRAPRGQAPRLRQRLGHVPIHRHDAYGEERGSRRTVRLLAVCHDSLLRHGSKTPARVHIWAWQYGTARIRTPCVLGPLDTRCTLACTRKNNNGLVRVLVFCTWA
jgi:hypothetical protein